MRMAWILALLTAIWFGVMAFRAGENWILWGLGGGLFALVVTTVVIGLGEAAFIPWSNRQGMVLWMREVGVAVAIILILGVLFTWNLHRRRCS